MLTNNLNKVRRNENLISIRPIENELNIYDLRFDKDFNGIKRQEVLRRYKFCEKVLTNYSCKLKEAINYIMLNILSSVGDNYRCWLRDFVHLIIKYI